MNSGTCSDKLLVVLQYWKGDQEQMRQLAKLLSEVNPGPGADVLLASRFDCPIDSAIVEPVKRRFNIRTHKCRRHVTGWPGGPNDMWFDVIDHVYEQATAGKMPWYKALFTCEADGAPLVHGWVEKLSACWDRARASAVGCILPRPAEHMNGNMMLDGGEPGLRWIRKLGGCNVTLGWDVCLAKQFKAHGWAHVSEILSWWRHPGPYTLPFLDELRQRGVVWFHGCKDTSLIKAVRESLFSVKVEKVNESPLP